MRLTDSFSGARAAHELKQRLVRIEAVEDNRVDRFADREFDAMAARETDQRARGGNALDHGNRAGKRVVHLLAST